MSSLKPKRKHIGSACQRCRGSKIKCDGVRPVCGNCSRKEKDCRYTFKDDKRRVSLRSAVDILSSQVSILGQTLTHNGIPIPVMDAEQEQTLKEICDTLDISIFFLQDQAAEPNQEQSSPVNTSSQALISQVTDRADSLLLRESSTCTTDVPIVNQRSTGEQDYLSLSDGYPTDGSIGDWPWDMIENDPFFLSSPQNLSLPEVQLNPTSCGSALATSTNNVFNHTSRTNGGLSSDEEPDSDLVREVSARFGGLRIASDGQLRYYGAATNYHLLEGSRHDEGVEAFTTKQEILDRLEQAGLDQDVPTDLETHLVDLYFTWHNPSHVNVDKDTFLAARSEDAPHTASAVYAGDVLSNAICAIGAAYENRYHPTFVTYPRSLADYFASKAKILLEAELDCPTISTVQGLCLLSNYEAARSRDARTWLYGGLHIDCTSYVHAGLLSSNDVRIRQRTFWSCVVINHLSSFHFGRPFRIDSEEITVESPLQTTSDMTSDNVGSDGNKAITVGSSAEILKAWLFLCELMVPLMRKLYGSSSIPVTTLQEISSSVTHRLEEWFANLPVTIQMTTNQKPSPELILLQYDFVTDSHGTRCADALSMSYHHFQILIHRPWTSRRSQPWTGQGPGFRHARKTCSTSASNITQLLVRYEKEYSFRCMHSYAVNIVFSAALVCLFDAIALEARPPANVTISEATANLSVFFRALDDMSRSFDSAKRAREHLATIQRKWYFSGTQPRSKSKRVHSPVDTVTTRQKRLRTAYPTSFPA